MLGWLCLLGWLLFISVTSLGLGLLNELSHGPFGSVHDVDTNWGAIKKLVIAIWIISIILKVAIWGWW